MDLDLYGLLAVDPGATHADIRTAYFKLAKQLHPDRQASDDPMATERFLAVQNAYETLADPARREEYDRSRIVKPDGGSVATADDKAAEPPKKAPAIRSGPTIEEARDARLAFQKALNLFDGGQADRALRAMQVVVRTVPDEPEYLSFLGYLMATEGEKLHAARDYCRQAVEGEPYNPEFHARLGYVYTRAGLNNTAAKCFEQALQLDPTHELALRHRRSGGGDDAGGGLLGSLKKLLSGGK